MFKYKSLLVVTLTFSMSFSIALFSTNPVAAQPSNNQVIIGNEKSRPKITSGLRRQCTYRFWGCLNFNSRTNPLLRIFSPATTLPEKPKPECKNNAWACPILAPQGNTSPSQSSFK